MTFGVFCVRDVRTGFMTPTVDQSDDSAIRNFLHAVRSSSDILHSYAQDFTLYRIADFDTESGAITPTSPIVFLAGGLEALSRREADET